MGKPNESKSRSLIIVGTGTAIVGFVAAALGLFIKYYEIQKSRAEAERAQVEADRIKQDKLPPHDSASSEPTVPVKDGTKSITPGVATASLRSLIGTLQGHTHSVWGVAF